MYIIYNLGLSGKTKSFVELIQGLDKKRYFPHVVCLEKKGVLAKRLEDLGIEVLSNDKKPGLDLILPLKLSYIMKKKRIDIEHAYSTPPIFNGGLATRLARIPAVVGSLRA